MRPERTTPALRRIWRLDENPVWPSCKTIGDLAVRDEGVARTLVQAPEISSDVGDCRLRSPRRRRLCRAAPALGDHQTWRCPGQRDWCQWELIAIASTSSSCRPVRFCHGAFGEGLQADELQVDRFRQILEDRQTAAERD